MLTKDWFVSSFTAANNTCVEVKMEDGVVYARNSNARDAGTANFTSDQWQSFVNGAKNGAFDLV